MSTAKSSRILLVIGDTLLVASVFVPWMILTSSTFGSPPIQYVSPGGIIWNTILNNPAIESGSLLLGPSLIYLGAMLAVVGLSIPLARGRVRGSRVIPLATIAEISTGVCGLWGLFAAAVLPTALNLGSPYPDVALTFGLPLVFVGALLTFASLMSIGRARMER